MTWARLIKRCAPVCLTYAVPDVFAMVLPVVGSTVKTGVEDAVDELDHCCDMLLDEK